MYEGEYADNMKQGQGIMTFPDKSKYEGEADRMLCIAAGSSWLFRTQPNAPC